MAEIDKKFIVNLQGKEFVMYEGLLDVAHQMKLKSIRTELVQIPTQDNGNTCIMKATAITEDEKVFEGYGDANPSNTNRNIAKHSIRMAETRAKARALRDLTNIGMTAIEELGEDDAGNKQGYQCPNQQRNKGQAKTLHCEGCGTLIDSRVASYSKSKFNKLLCMNCQKKAR